MRPGLQKVWLMVVGLLVAASVGLAASGIAEAGAQRAELYTQTKAALYEASLQAQTHPWQVTPKGQILLDPRLALANFCWGLNKTVCQYSSQRPWQPVVSAQTGSVSWRFAIVDHGYGVEASVQEQMPWRLLGIDFGMHKVRVTLAYESHIVKRSWVGQILHVQGSVL